MAAHGLRKNELLTAEDKAAIIKMRCEGGHPDDIADEFLVSREWIYRLTQHLKMPLRPSSRVSSKSKILALHAQGETLEHIVRKVGTHREYAKRIIREAHPDASRCMGHGNDGPECRQRPDRGGRSSRADRFYPHRAHVPRLHQPAA
ncbi:hypothetical protein [Methylobacterium sp. WL120]|uniref:hypothetical protein n=1 Tax=Methylobacterium sp. WL120 TaxID=2603887 RepID=UPI001FEFBE8E|nr:hypothetical protein [Methylobacterium sp. WL120]